jgi:hypothetical protein
LSNFQKILLEKHCYPRTDGKFPTEVARKMAAMSPEARSADLVPGSTRFRHRVYDDFSGEKVPLAEVDSDLHGEKVMVPG